MQFEKCLCNSTPVKFTTQQLLPRMIFSFCECQFNRGRMFWLTTKRGRCWGGGHQRGLCNCFMQAMTASLIRRMDFLSRKQRRRLMAKVRGKNTKVEIELFQLLKHRRIPFEKHVSDLRGRPDVVFRECNLAVFVDGDFWHGRNYRVWQKKLNPFWKQKIEANIRRDRRTDRRLRSEGWSILHVWGSDLTRRPEKALNRILNARLRRYRNSCGIVRS